MFLRKPDTCLYTTSFFSCMRDHVLFPHLLYLIFSFHCNSEMASVRLIIQANYQVLCSKPSISSLVPAGGQTG